MRLIHALSFGIPTIASDISGGDVEIVRDRESGLLFKKGNSADLAAVVRFLATDGALRARLADGGRCSAARFTFEQMIAAMEDFLAQQKRSVAARRRVLSRARGGGVHRRPSMPQISGGRRWVGWSLAEHRLSLTRCHRPSALPAASSLTGRGLRWR